jgi:hypothetical protein
MSTGPNPVKRKEKWRIKPKNRIHSLSMSNGKKEINIRMEAPFGDSKDMGKCVPYIFLHNFTGRGVSCRCEAQQYHGAWKTAGEKFPVEVKHNNAMPDRKLYAKSFLSE